MRAIFTYLLAGGVGAPCWVEGRPRNLAPDASNLSPHLPRIPDMTSTLNHDCTPDEVAELQHMLPASSAGPHVGSSSVAVPRHFRGGGGEPRLTSCPC